MWWKNEAPKGVVLKHAKDVWLSSLSKHLLQSGDWDDPSVEGANEEGSGVATNEGKGYDMSPMNPRGRPTQ